jgi:predicted deacylase
MKKISFEKFNTAIRKEALRLNLGVEVLANNSLHLYRHTGKPLVGVLAGLHGDENSGPLTVLEWLRGMDKVKFDCSLFPLANNSGWDTNSREWEKFDLNRAFNQLKGPLFVRQMMRVLRASPPAIFLDLHEDYSADAAYIFKYVKDTRVADYLQKRLKIRCKPWDDAAVWKYCSEVFVRRQGCSSCITVEAAGALDMKERILRNVEIIEKAMRYCFSNHQGARSSRGKALLKTAAKK